MQCIKYIKYLSTLIFFFSDEMVRNTKCLHFGYFSSYSISVKQDHTSWVLKLKSYGKGLSLYHMVLHQ